MKCPCCDSRISNHIEGVNFVDSGIVEFMQIPLVQIVCQNKQCGYGVTLDIGTDICKSILSKWDKIDHDKQAQIWRKEKRSFFPPYEKKD